MLIPAVLFDRSCWWPVAAELRPDATVIAVDLPGHGASARRPRYQPGLLVDELAALLAHENITQAPVIVGHASSAGLAHLFATRYATHAVVTVDASPDIPADRTAYLRHMRLADLPHQCQPLAAPADDPDLLTAYRSCRYAASAPCSPAVNHHHLAVHSSTPPTPSSACDQVDRLEVYDVPGRFPQLTAVERFAADIRIVLQPRDPSAPTRNEGER